MGIEQARFNMVEQQIHPCEIFDEQLLAVLSAVKREYFVAKEYAGIAFSDVEIPLPGGQKMLLPRVTAKLVQELDLKKTDKVLEVGTGSGYITAIMAKLAEFVYSLEINPENKQFAVHNLTVAGINNVSVMEANGIDGMAQRSPFDKIFVGGGLDAIPATIKSQLKVDGVLVGFVGAFPTMHAVKVVRVSENKYIQTELFETDVEYLTGSSSKEIFKL